MPPLLWPRYGLGKVLNNEDMQALSRRLHKDLLLLCSGEAAQNQELRSAKLYQQTYDAEDQAYLFYYSGINAATMAMPAGFLNACRINCLLSVQNQGWQTLSL